MSVLGSHIAASIAPASLQAQQVARLKQQQGGNPQDEIRRVQEMFQSHLQALEDSDQNESSARLRVDGQLPEHQSAGQQRREPPRRQAPAPEPINDAGPQAAPASAEAPRPEEALYRHLDVQA